MQINNQPKGLVKSLVTWGLVGFMSLVSAGCFEENKTYKHPTFTPEQTQARLDYMREKTKEKNLQSDANLKYMRERRDLNQQTPQQGSTGNEANDKLNEWVWSVYKGALIRSGGNIISHEYIQEDTK